MISRERTIVKLQVGHESEMFEQPLANGHTFRWTVFIRPVAGSVAASFSKSFISKVKFTLHDSYEQSVRIVREAPFQITETGYGSFSPIIEIYFNYPGAKAIKYAYDMMLQMERRAESKEDINLELKDAPSTFTEIARRFGAKRKRSGTDGSNCADSLFPPLKLHKSDDGRSPRDSQSKKDVVRSGKDSKEKQSNNKEQKRLEKERIEKKREKEKLADKREKKKEKEKSSKSSPEIAKVNRDTPSSLTIRTVPQKPVKHAPSKTDEKRAAPTMLESDISSPSTSYGSLTPRTPLSTQTTSSSSSPMTPAEMHRRMAQLTDGEQIFRVAAILISLPGTNILPSKQALNFNIDLNSADPTIIARLCEALS